MVCIICSGPVFFHKKTDIVPCKRCTIMLPRRLHDDYALLGPCYAWCADPFLTLFRRRILKAVQQAGCTQVLDLCCGTGQQCRLMHSQGLHCAGLDQSWSMLQRARQTNAPEQLFILGSACAVPFPEHSFDGIVISLALHEMPLADRQNVLREVDRVLKPRGKLFVFDFEPPVSLAGQAVHLGLSVIERLAGPKHYQASRDFLRTRGIQGLLSCWSGALIQHRTMFCGAFALAVLQKDSICNS